MSAAFTDAELARRRIASRRMGWALGIVVLIIYVVGLFIPR